MKLRLHWYPEVVQRGSDPNVGATLHQLTSAQHSHPHAYMTPDNRFVIFNSDRTGLCQLWGAEIPAGFLEALDLPVPGV